LGQGGQVRCPGLITGRAQDRYPVRPCFVGFSVDKCGKSNCLPGHLNTHNVIPKTASSFFFPTSVTLMALVSGNRRIQFNSRNFSKSAFPRAPEM
jgi:hypothetical protein